MSGKMKKLICALLTGTMVLSSVGLIGFAADDTNAASTDTAAAAESTAAPEAAEATAAPEAEAATPTPAASPVQAAPTSTAYDSDAYYQKALALCQGLGIITGYEDGSVKPESTVTRAEMSAIILRMLANSSTSTYQNIFTDVAASHWAANTIQTASALGIVNGMGDGTFLPDGNVQYEQVAKMIVCAMNYGETADYYGGYPNGFLKVASDLDITKNAPGNTGVAAERGVVIKMVYNALLADYNEPDGTEYGVQKFKAERTLAEYAFDVVEEKGTLLGTATTSLTGKDILKGNVVISSKTKGDDEELQRTYTTDLTGLDSLIASNITFYYETQNNGDDRKLLAIAENTAKTTTVTLSNDDVADIENFLPNNLEGMDEIKLYKKTKMKIADGVDIVYNGTLVTRDDFERAQSANKNDPRFYYDDDNDSTTDMVKKTFAEFLKPAVGTIRLVENDDDVEGYDIIFIDSYETLLVTTATSKKVSGKIDNTLVSINVDEEANDLTISTTIKGMEGAPRNLKKNDVVSLKRDIEGENFEFVVSGETVTGSVRSKTDDSDTDKIYADISGTEYEVDKNADEDCKIGLDGIFYLDNFGRIGYVEAATAQGLLQSGENYGWIMGVYVSDDGEDKVVKLYGQDGKAVEGTLAENVDFWSKDGNERLSGDAVFEKLTKEESGKRVINDDAFLHVSGDYAVIRLVKYKINSSNEISRLYCAVDSSTEDDTSALRINPTNLTGVASINGSINGNNIADGIVEFTVPQVTSDMTNASNYSIGEAVAENYVIRENGTTRNYVIGEFNNNVNANIIINFTASASDPAKFDDLDSAGTGPSVMVVDKIAAGVDDDDNDIYTISGYVGGSSVSVTTNRNTNFGDAKTPIWGGTSNRYFQATPLWNAAGQSNVLNKLNEDVKDGDGNVTARGLKRGDILLYSSDGKILIRYTSASAAKFDDETGLPVEKPFAKLGDNDYSNSTSRVHYYFDEITDKGSDDVAWVQLKNMTNRLTFDASVAMDLVKISTTGNVTLEKTAIDISEVEAGDYIFVYIADKGSMMKSMVVYRIEQ